MNNLCTCGQPVTVRDLQADCSRCNRILHAGCARGHGEREYCEACAPPGVRKRVRAVCPHLHIDSAGLCRDCGKREPGSGRG
jgi:hypothetical protein